MDKYTAVVTRTVDQNSEDELMHYGVLGMKWGVRRATKAYNTATTKADKAKAKERLETHMAKASKKLDKYDRKSQKKMDKALRKRYGLLGSNRKYAKAEAKAERQMYKGDKWYKNMEKTFGKQSVVSLSDRDIQLGKKYANFFERGADFKGSNYHRERR